MLLVAGLWKEFEEFEELAWGSNDNIWVFLTDTNGFFEMGVFLNCRGTRPKLTLPVFGFMVCLGFFGYVE